MQNNTVRRSPKPRRPVVDWKNNKILYCPRCGYYSGLDRKKNRCTHCGQLIKWN